MTDFSDFGTVRRSPAISQEALDEAFGIDRDPGPTRYSPHYTQCRNEIGSKLAALAGVLAEGHADMMESHGEYKDDMFDTAAIGSVYQDLETLYKRAAELGVYFAVDGRAAAIEFFERQGDRAFTEIEREAIVEMVDAAIAMFTHIHDSERAEEIEITRVAEARIAARLQISGGLTPEEEADDYRAAEDWVRRQSFEFHTQKLEQLREARRRHGVARADS
jgi:hypothetical protein